MATRRRVRAPIYTDGDGLLAWFVSLARCNKSNSISQSGSSDGGSPSGQTHFPAILSILIGLGCYLSIQSWSHFHSTWLADWLSYLYCSWAKNRIEPRRIRTAPWQGGTRTMSCLVCNSPRVAFHPFLLLFGAREAGWRWRRCSQYPMRAQEKNHRWRRKVGKGRWLRNGMKFPGL